ncbi:unnamed protein product [Caenorhabditis bovis]|uniref:Uncharacterized protein n=1 Tax=Caenorhabditis bovis TaxID=2654633 RepID=A0A8S1EYF1_9PELO|nr:unnamed protein product [Caenorhabditis bovis]
MATHCEIPIVSRPYRCVMSYGVYTLILILLLPLAAHADDDCAAPHFVVETSRRFNSTTSSRLLNRQPVDSLSQCVRLCRLLKRCTRFEVASDGGQLVCTLLNPDDDVVVVVSPNTIAGTRVCLKRPCREQRAFAFERFAKRALANTTHILKTFSIRLDECLQKCHDESNCRSVAYNSHTSLCQLSRVAMNAVYNPRLFFKPSTTTDVYENNCQDYATTMTTNGCTFMRMTGGGLKALADQTIAGVGDSHECEQLMYTFDNSSKSCHLMYASARILGRSPLEKMDAALSHGDLDDCINFSLKCRDSSLEVKASSLRLFNGKMAAMSGRRSSTCEHRVDGEFAFAAKFEFDKCAIEETNHSEFRGVIHVKEGSTNLVTIRDKTLQVSCRMHQHQHQHHQVVSIRMNVDANNKTMRLVSNPPERPTFALRVYTNDEREASAVTIGETGWIVVTVENAAVDRFIVTNLASRDVNTGEIRRLVDDDGCVIRRDLVAGIRKSPDEIRYRIAFVDVAERAEIVYHASVETCATADCEPACNRELYEGTQRSSPLALDLPRRMLKRAIIGENRQLELLGDVYQVRGHKLTLLNSRARAGPAQAHHTENDDDVIITKKEVNLAASFRHCFVDDVTCLFTIILASIQFFLLLCCCLIVYVYFQHWRMFRALESAGERHQIEFYEYGSDVNSIQLDKDDSESPPQQQQHD